MGPYVVTRRVIRGTTREICRPGTRQRAVDDLVGEVDERWQSSNRRSFRDVRVDIRNHRNR